MTESREILLLKEQRGTSAQVGPVIRSVSIAPGVKVPYPEPTSAAATATGRANVRSGTKPEVRLRSALHRRGLRFRKDHALRLEKVRVRPDIVFTRCRLAVFIDGCFWHSCPDHQHVPRSNRDYWVPKLEGNVARDRRVDGALVAEGWTVIRVWEHEDPEEAALAIVEVLERLR